MHGHQQSGGAQAAAPEAGLDHGRGLREVHARTGLRTAGRLRALGQTDALSLSELSVRRARAVPDDGAQVPAHGMKRRRRTDARGHETLVAAASDRFPRILHDFCPCVFVARLFSLTFVI